MSHLKLPEPLKVNKSIAREFDKLEEKGKTFFPFIAYPTIEMLFQLFLIKKYKSNCLVLGKNSFTYSAIGISIRLKLNYTKTEEAKMKDEFSHISKQIVECIKKGEKTIMIPLFYTVGIAAHQNVLIYRKDLVQLEHFEPHGAAFRSNEKIQKSSTNILIFFTNILNSYLKLNNIKEVKFIEASQVCPYISGLQSLEGKSKLKKPKLEKGYCAAWSMFFSELCLKNPEISSSEIMENIYNYLTTKPSTEDYLRKIIRGYTGYIFETVNTYLEIFFRPKITIFDLISFTKSDNSKIIKIENALRILVSIESKALLDPDFNLKEELRQANQEYKEKTKGMTKEEAKVARHKNFVISLVYYKKRILQNYEEYSNYGKISEPILDSPLEIRKEEMINPDIITKRIPVETENNKKINTKSLKVKKASPNSKTKRRK